MKLVRWLIAAVALMSFFPTLPEAASGDPPFIIYRASGVFDDGSTNATGTATAIHCTNASSVSEDLLIVIRTFNGAVISSATQTYTISSFRTWTIVTHATTTFEPDANLSSGFITQGMVAIGSTTKDMFCSFMLVGAASTTPQGISLHPVRYNSSSGTQE
jgi:hypothetical protein